VGASDAAGVLNRSPFTTPLKIFLEKKGRLPLAEATTAMRIGTAMEPVIQEALTFRLGKEIIETQVCLRSDEHTFMTATLDGVDEDGELYEFKAPGAWSAKELGEDGEVDSLPEHWILQAQHQMFVGDFASATFAVMFPTAELILYLLDRLERGGSGTEDMLRKLELRTYTVQRNDSLIDAMVALESRFWEHFVADVPPSEIDPSDAKTLSEAFRGERGEVRVSRDCAYAMGAWVDLGPKIKELEDERDAAKARVLIEMGDAVIGYCPDGKTIKRSIVETKQKVAKSAGEVIRKASRSVRIALKGASV
jgi:putative phage-type endonuclease